jgi:uncharacterized repeat protein (TIGR04052 family)
MTRSLALAAILVASPAAAQTTPVTISMAAVVGSQPFSCAASYEGIGTTASTVRMTDFRFFVSNVRLTKADGTTVPLALKQDGLWQVDDVALIDFEDATGSCTNGTTPTRTVIEGTAPSGTYTGVTFDLGLPFDKNHRDPAVQPSPLNLTRLFWSWNAGYKFMRLDMRTTGMPQGWVIHLGSTGCDGATATVSPKACRQPNLATIALKNLNLATDVIELDVKTLLAGSNVDKNEAQALGCMSGPADPECGPLFTQLGLAFGTATPATQAVFKVRPAAMRDGGR